MPARDGDKERFGPALRIAALAATVLALAAIIGPRLASSGGGGSDGTAASLPLGATAGLLTTTTSRPEATTSSTGPAGTGTTSLVAPTTTTAATTTTRPPVATTTTAPAAGPVEVPADAGDADLALVGLHLGRYGPERSGFFGGDAIGWHLRVTNTGDEYLWGVFVYLELYGPVSCSVRRLDVGQSADCWAETVAVAGENEADAWVTAWTELRMVTDRLSYRVAATAG